MTDVLQRLTEGKEGTKKKTSFRYPPPVVIKRRKVTQDTDYGEEEESDDGEDAFKRIIPSMNAAAEARSRVNTKVRPVPPSNLGKKKIIAPPSRSTSSVGRMNEVPGTTDSPTRLDLAAPSMVKGAPRIERKKREKKVLHVEAQLKKPEGTNAKGGLPSSIDDWIQMREQRSRPPISHVPKKPKRKPLQPPRPPKGPEVRVPTTPFAAEQNYQQEWKNKTQPIRPQRALPPPQQKKRPAPLLQPSQAKRPKTAQDEEETQKLIRAVACIRLEDPLTHEEKEYPVFLDEDVFGRRGAAMMQDAFEDESSDEGDDDLPTTRQQWRDGQRQHRKQLNEAMKYLWGLAEIDSASLSVERRAEKWRSFSS